MGKGQINSNNKEKGIIIDVDNTGDRTQKDWKEWKTGRVIKWNNENKNTYNHWLVRLVVCIVEWSLTL